MQPAVKIIIFRYYWPDRYTGKQRDCRN